MKEPKITALYERTQEKDQFPEVRNSITTQKKQLEDYATTHGFGNIVHFTDDGVSGVLFGADRPGFASMMSEIEIGNVGICLCRDMTRLGRGFFPVGRCIETMMVNGVRLIAINGDFDSNKDEDELRIFRGILNMINANGKGSKQSRRQYHAEH